MKKADKYIIIGIAILLVISMIGVYIFKTLFSKSGATALVTQNGTIIHDIDLNKVSDPYEFIVEADNGGYNTIYVENGKIKFNEADCPDQLCVQTGFLTNTNDISVCLPHGLFIEIQGGMEGEIDILSH